MLGKAFNGEREGGEGREEERQEVPKYKSTFNIIDNRFSNLMACLGKIQSIFLKNYINKFKIAMCTK